MATKLGLYQAAQIELGTATIGTLSDDVKSRHDLDVVYDRVLAECLQEANWKFAIRSVKVDADETPPSFGFSHAFSKPDDWVRTTALSTGPDFHRPLDRFESEIGFWMSNADPIYVKYVSNGGEFGADLDTWPSSYARYVELSLAARVCMAVTGSRSLLGDLSVLLRRAKGNAKSIDAVEGPPRFFPAGNWVKARGAGVSSTRHDRQDP